MVLEKIHSLLEDQVVPLRYENGKVSFVDQRALPLRTEWIEAKNSEDIFHIIRDMVVRGAPAIGIAAGFGIALAFSEDNFSQKSGTTEELDHVFRQTKERLAESRPTAVNLFWALERMQKLFNRFLAQQADKNSVNVASFYQTLEKEALLIWLEDIENNQAMGEFGASILPDGGILTHCNAGALATGGYGTALGVIRSKFKRNKNLHVFVDETRPYLQGARLTAYELFEEGIALTLISDNMAAMVMSQGKVQGVVVGADRIAANGDTANKIGTMGVAILARHFSIPVFIAAPLSTFDLTLADGSHIPIEERSSKELTQIQNHPFTADYPVYNPGFDVTPHELIRAIITEKGLIERPNTEAIAAFFSKHSGEAGEENRDKTTVSAK